MCNYLLYYHKIIIPDTSQKIGTRNLFTFDLKWTQLMIIQLFWISIRYVDVDLNFAPFVKSDSWHGTVTEEQRGSVCVSIQNIEVVHLIWALLATYKQKQLVEWILQQIYVDFSNKVIFMSMPNKWKGYNWCRRWFYPESEGNQSEWTRFSIGIITDNVSVIKKTIFEITANFVISYIFI